MRRVFSPEDEPVHWDDLRPLPEVGSLFFDLADSLADRPVSRKLDTAILGGDEIGLLTEVPLPAAITIDPVKLLSIIASKRTYRGVRREHSLANVIAVSRVSGAIAEAIYGGRLDPAAEEPEEMRMMYHTILRKISISFILPNPRTMEKNARPIDIYTALGKIIIRPNYFYEPD